MEAISGLCVSGVAMPHIANRVYSFIILCRM